MKARYGYNQWKTFWISIRKAKHCFFVRRNGLKGKIIFGYSVCIRIFGKNII